MNICASDDNVKTYGDYFVNRQVGRLDIVGSNDTTKPVIEQSYLDFLEAFKAHIKHYPFALGQRPSACDFAMYGQLSQLTHFDPTPMSITLKNAASVYTWVDLLEDQSALEPQDNAWIDKNNLPDTLGQLCKLIDKYYTPFLAANAQALTNNQKQFKTKIAGQDWEQSTFAYQGKCLQWTRDKFAHLSTTDQKFVKDFFSKHELNNIMNNLFSAVKHQLTA